MSIGDFLRLLGAVLGLVVLVVSATIQEPNGTAAGTALALGMLLWQALVNADRRR